MISLEPYKDPDEFIKALGTEAFQKRIDEAQSSFLFEVEVLERGYNLKDPAAKTAFFDETAKKLLGFSDELERNNYIEAVASKYGVPYETLRRKVNQLGLALGGTAPKPKPRELSGQKKPKEEGTAARAYFDVFDGMILHQREDFKFAGRTKRPPLDAVNAMLSFVYALLANDAEAALEGVGLDPAVGFLHKDRSGRSSGRSSLALDLMEEFRPWLADRLVLSMINKQQVKPENFRTTESGAVTMDDGARKKILAEWHDRKQDEITHPYTGEKMPLGMVPHMQAMLLARRIRGDMKEYPPFVWK